MIKKELKNYLQKHNKTLLGVGPMSQNCIDVVINISNTKKIPIQLIASRRQIECSQLGSGYVNNWSTEEFCKYVKDNDREGFVLLSRDHGGPWQNYSEVENKLEFQDALVSSKVSFATDIECGFDFIHLDPSVDIFNKISNNEILNRIENLYHFTIEESKKQKNDVYIELGTEEQIEGMNNYEEVEYNLNHINKFCIKNDYPTPFFYVVQNGSKVKEIENTGVFKNISLKNYRKDSSIKKLISINQLCLDFGILPKAHNSDYLSSEISSIYPKINLKGGNIAPEFGVIETMTILDLFKSHDLKKQYNKLIELSINSKKWEKWMKVDSNADEEKKAIIAGHYIFSSPEFAELKEEANFHLNQKGVDLDYEIKLNLDASITSYLKSYGW